MKAYRNEMKTKIREESNVERKGIGLGIDNEMCEIVL